MSGLPPLLLYWRITLCSGDRGVKQVGSTSTPPKDPINCTNLGKKDVEYE